MVVLFVVWVHITMEMQSRDYYYHFQTYLPTRSSGLLRLRNIKSNRYGLTHAYTKCSSSNFTFKLHLRVFKGQRASVTYVHTIIGEQSLSLEK